MMHPLVEQFEKQFLPELELLASEMRHQHPTLTFNVWRGPVGTLTEQQGYDFGVECLIPRTTPDVSDNVALSMELSDLTATPRLMAEVGWGHPFGHVEAIFQNNWLTSAEWPEASPKTLDELRRAFPKLVQAFKSAVERGAQSR
jgi:hypothetical protein